MKIGAIACAGMACAAGLCVAQAADGLTRAEGVTAVTITPQRPADPEIKAVSDLLVGSWKTMAPNPATGEKAEMWMHIAPIRGEGLNHAFYVEHAWGESLGAPSRQSIFELYRFKGDRIRLRTLEFKSPGRGEVLGALWAAPDMLPPVRRDELIATLDIELTKAGSGFAGKTPYPYPTAIGGAVEMTTELTLNRGALTTHDVGFDADGKIAWGGSKDEALTWTRGEVAFKVNRRDDGLVIITLNEGEGPTPEEGHFVHVHYAGWLANGNSLESTRRFGNPYVARMPFQGIEAWKPILETMKKGQHVRFIAPPELAFKDQERPNIPANSTLYFDMECMHIEAPGDAPAQPSGPLPIPTPIEQPTDDR